MRYYKKLAKKILEYSGHLSGDLRVVAARQGFIFCADYDGNLFFRHAAETTVVEIPRQHNGIIDTVSILQTKDAMRLVSSGRDGRLCMYQPDAVHSLQLINTFNMPFRRVKWVFADTDPDLVHLVSDCGKHAVFNINTAEFCMQAKEYAEYLALSCDGRHWAGINADGVLICEEWKAPDQYSCLIHAEKDKLIAGKANGALTLLDVTNGQRLDILETGLNNLDSIACENGTIFCGNHSQWIARVRIEKGRHLVQYSFADMMCPVDQFTVDDGKVIAVCTDGVLRRWGPENGKTFVVHGDPLGAGKFIAHLSDICMRWFGESFTAAVKRCGNDQEISLPLLVYNAQKVADFFVHGGADNEKEARLFLKLFISDRKTAAAILKNMNSMLEIMPTLLTENVKAIPSETTKMLANANLMQKVDNSQYNATIQHHSQRRHK